MTELVFRYIKLGIAFALVWFLLYFWTSCSYKGIKGKEMAPALAPGENYWVRIKERTPETLESGAIIAFDYQMTGSSGADTLRAARVRGLPGQRIKMVKGELFINGRKEGTVVGRPDETYEEVIVPRDSFFILMENREIGPSYDSRAIGPLGAGAVHGRINK
jgi:signal peptidase I